MPKKTTIDDLAAMIKRGFDGVDKRLDATATKDDFHALGQRIDKVEDIQRDMLEELNATHADVRYIRSTVDKLVHSDIAHDATIQDLTSRVHRLEQKAGLAK